DAHRVELARGDREANQIIGLQSVRIGPLLHFPIETALDTAEPHRILPKHFVLFGGYRHPRLVGEDLFVLVAWHGAVPSEAARLFAFYSPSSTLAYRELPRQEKEDLLNPLFIHYGWLVLRGENSLLLLHGLQHCYCSMACTAFLPCYAPSGAH